MSIHEVSELVANEYGLTQRERVQLVRCLAALDLFEEGHPERVEAEELLQNYPKLWDAVCELDENLLRLETENGN